MLALTLGPSRIICGLYSRPEPVQNLSGVSFTLTAPARDKPQTLALLGFRLMPVSHSVKAWSKCRRPSWYGLQNRAVATMVAPSYLEDPITLLLILDFAVGGTFRDGRPDTVQTVLHSCIRCIRLRIKHYRR